MRCGRYTRGGAHHPVLWYSGDQRYIIPLAQHEEFQKLMIQAEGRCDLLEAVTGAKKIRLAFRLNDTMPAQRSYFREVFKKPQLDWGEPAINVNCLAVRVALQ
jgi:hypothetical protein